MPGSGHPGRVVAIADRFGLARSSPEGSSCPSLEKTCREKEEERNTQVDEREREKDRDRRGKRDDRDEESFLLDGVTR